MSEIISMPDGQCLDLDTFDGQYRYVGYYLNAHGADSKTFSCLGRMWRTHTDSLLRQGGVVCDIYIPEPKC